MRKLQWEWFSRSSGVGQPELGRKQKKLLDSSLPNTTDKKGYQQTGSPPSAGTACRCTWAPSMALIPGMTLHSSPKTVALPHGTEAGEGSRGRIQGAGTGVLWKCSCKPSMKTKERWGAPTWQTAPALDFWWQLTPSRSNERTEKWRRHSPFLYPFHFASVSRQVTLSRVNS